MKETLLKVAIQITVDANYEIIRDYVIVDIERIHYYFSTYLTLEII